MIDTHFNKLNSSTSGTRENGGRLNKDFGANSFLKYDELNSGRQLFKSLESDMFFRENNNEPQFDFLDFMQDLRQNGIVSTEWLKKNMNILKKLIGVEIFDSEDLNIVADDMIRNRDKVIRQTGDADVRGRKSFVQENFSDVQIWDKNSAENILNNILSSKKQNPLFFHFRDSAYSRPLNPNVVQRKTNFHIAHADSISELKTEISNAKYYYALAPKRTIIIAHDLLNELNSPENLEFVKSLGEKDEKCPVFYVFEEGFNMPSQINTQKIDFGCMQVLENEMNVFEERFLQPASAEKYGSAKVPSVIVFEETGREKADIFVNSLLSDKNFVVKKLDKNLKASELFSELNESISRSNLLFALEKKRTVLFVPDVFRFLKDNPMNLKYLKDKAENTDRVTFIFSTSLKDRFDALWGKSDNRVDIKLSPYTDKEIQNIFDYYINLASDEVNERITKGENIPALNLSLNNKILFNIPSSSDARAKFTIRNIENIVNEAKRDYLEQGNKSFEAYLKEYYTSFLKD